MSGAVHAPERALWKWMIAFTIAIAISYPLVPSLAYRDGVAILIGSLAVIAITASYRRFAPEHRRFGAFLALGMLATTLGDVGWTYQEAYLGIEMPFPTYADAFYLASYPLLALALWSVSRPQPNMERAGLLVDCAIVTSALAVMSWHFIIRPALALGDVSVGVQLTSAAYPMLGLLLLAALVLMQFRRTAPRPVLILLALGTLSSVLADATFAIATQYGLYATGMPSDIGWLLMYGLFGAAGLHPALRSAVTHDQMNRPVNIERRLALLLTAAVLVPFATVLQGLLGHTAGATAVAMETLIVLGLVFVRMSIMARSLQRSEHELALQHEALLESYDDRRRLLRELVETAERECSRISGDLHDGPIQQLAAIGYLAGRLDASPDSDTLGTHRPTINALTSELSRVVGELRLTLQDLRPAALTQTGLTSAIEAHAKRFEAQHTITCNVDVDIEERLGADEETALYRVMIEALTNVAKHANASSVQMRLTSRGDSTTLSIIDDGIGFDTELAHQFVQDGSFGMAIMRERMESFAGSLIAKSEAGSGTTVIATIPSHHREQEAA